ncbi:NitT/TauT family transport system substrate-binding protein [Herbaspirillum sp. Sphag1AN]|uniref:NrtA/SsuA/CpmA family ABC transporter substrate-binding protein n=1 Tax=unclassified Herbaspirillum TaxID=2624150 RepID=UPI00183AF182|nr:MULTISPECIES: NrtA/SsuA/CpmA family ABC transporter substrate-binding protein [unclassified Herbaspirillum]MBB3211856.1 NitT/TauT family transport system substrate-binding protein [Herbaspirillum sp. Sphag1AN]MBB3244310.1 NitT/TauT family transport system substrate-binding protein [Herbaspirillum sp. Sphag64]
MQHRIGRFVLTGIAIFLTLSADVVNAAEKIRLAQNLAPISGLVIIAKQKNLFEKYGLDVTVSNFTSGRQALETVLGGGADIATTAEAPITAAALARQKIALLARMEYSDDKTLLSKNAGINTAADLKGKRIGYTVGTGSEIYTWSLLKKAGLSKSDVTLVNLRPQDMVAALASNSIDAYNTWEPHISNGKKALGDKVKELDTKGVYAETFNLVVTEEYLAKNEKTVTAFLKAVLEAEHFLTANREESVSIIAGVTGMKKEELAEIWNDYFFELVLDERVLTTLKNHADWRLETGNAPGGATLPDFHKIIFAAPLKAVAPERVKIPGL